MAETMKVWLNDDLMAGLRTVSELKTDSAPVAAGLHRRFAERCWPSGKARGFFFAGWTKIELSDEEASLLRCLRPSCFLREDA